MIILWDSIIYSCLKGKKTETEKLYKSEAPSGVARQRCKVN